MLKPGNKTLARMGECEVSACLHRLGCAKRAQAAANKQLYAQLTAKCMVPAGWGFQAMNPSRS
jgi:hypothetical protein